MIFDFHYQPLEVKFTGPDLALGPKPTLIYFSLCAEESLNTDPYNQPARFLKDSDIRIFSITLPGHGQGFDKFSAMQYWADHLEELTTFIKKCEQFIHHLIELDLAAGGQIGVMGLSRGGLIATHLGALKSVSAILGFAPVTELKALMEFKNASHAELEPLNCKALFSKLTQTPIRFYIGNRDTRVGTQEAFSFIYELAEYAYHERIRSPQCELILSPSIGQYGHGTLPPTFKAGADWIKKQIVP